MQRRGPVSNPFSFHICCELISALPLSIELNRLQDAPVAKVDDVNGIDMNESDAPLTANETALLLGAFATLAVSMLSFLAL